MQKRIIVLLTILAFAVIYSLISLEQTVDGNHGFNHSTNPSNSNVSGVDSNNDKTFNNSGSIGKTKREPNSTVKTQNKLNSQGNSLPFEFLVVGISDLVVNKSPVPKTELKILIEYQNEYYEYSLKDYLLNSDMQLVSIEVNKINILYKTSLFTKMLIKPNMLSSMFKKEEKNYEELLAMTAKEIGTRPRIIEHIVSLTMTPYIADGKLVSIGSNPKLFEQAGFKKDDVLKTVNGKSVTIETEFETIKRELMTAQSLKFEVMRKGRVIILYLDIPSETLELVRD